MTGGARPLYRCRIPYDVLGAPPPTPQSRRSAPSKNPPAPVCRLDSSNYLFQIKGTGATLVSTVAQVSKWTAVTCHLHIAPRVHHPESNRLLSPCVWPASPLPAPAPFRPVTAELLTVSVSLSVMSVGCFQFYLPHVSEIIRFSALSLFLFAWSSQDPPTLPQTAESTFSYT